MNHLLRSQLDQLPIGPFRLEHITENSYRLLCDNKEVAMISFAHLAAHAIDELDVSLAEWPVLLRSWVEEGGAHIRWVSSAHRPAAFPTDQYLADATELNPDNIQQQFARLSADRAYIGELHRSCVHKREIAEIERDQKVYNAKIELEQVEGLERLQAVSALKNKGHEKPTEALINAYIDSLPVVLLARTTYASVVFQAKQEAINALDWELKYKSVLGALASKENMLQMIGSHIREEMKIQNYNNSVS